MRRIPVCLTVDTEFSIGGAFAEPDRYRPVGARRVTCPAAGKQAGLGFLLDVFRAHEQRRLGRRTGTEPDARRQFQRRLRRADDVRPAVAPMVVNKLNDLM